MGFTSTDNYTVPSTGMTGSNLYYTFNGRYQLTKGNVVDEKQQYTLSSRLFVYSDSNKTNDVIDRKQYVVSITADDFTDDFFATLYTAAKADFSQSTDV